MIPIFIKVHEVIEEYDATNLVRVNVNEIKTICSTTNHGSARAAVDFGFSTMYTKESPAQIDNLIEKAILSRFKKIDDTV